MAAGRSFLPFRNGGGPIAMNDYQYVYTLQSLSQPNQIYTGQTENLFGSPNFRVLPRDRGSRCVSPAIPMKQSPRCAPSTPGRTARGVAATCSAWNRGTAGAIPAALTNFKFAAVAEYMRRPPSKRNDAGGNPAGSAIARWCQSSTAVC